MIMCCELKEMNPVPIESVKDMEGGKMENKIQVIQ